MDEHAPTESRLTSGGRGRISFRTVAGAVAFTILLVFVSGGNPLPHLRESLATIRRTAGLDLRARRLAGRGPAYDRRFFELVLTARDALPPGSKGLVLYAPGIPEWGGRYLAIYELAPLPVVDSPVRIREDWAALVYGRESPAGWRLLRSFPGGALLKPGP